MADNKNYITVDLDGNITHNLTSSVTISNQRPLEITVNGVAELEVTLKKAMDIHYVFNKNSQIKLTELRQFTNGGQFDRLMDVGANSKVLSILLNEGDHLENLTINDICHVQRDAEVEVSYGELCDGNIKANYTYELDEEGANAHLHLAAIAKEEDEKKFQVTLNHHAPNTYGLMENYGVTRNKSTLVFDGVGRIEKGMHQSNSHQTSRIIVFEPSCKAQANPYLYIDDYDVKASHAASVGAMNVEHLYYLQSRGLTKKQSMHLIMLGYLLPAIKVIDDENINQRFEDLLLRKVGDN